MRTDDDDMLWGYSTLGDGPDWRPLTSLLGERLATHFRWLNMVDFMEDGVAHSFRHEATGHYLDIHEDGRTLEYVGGGHYAVVHPVHAVGKAFAGWESRGPQDGAEQTMCELRRLHDRLSATHGPARELEPWQDDLGVPFPRSRFAASKRGSTTATVPRGDDDPTESAA